MGVGWVAMHMQKSPADMQDDPRYEDVVAEVRGYLLERARVAVDGGVSEVWLDPGIGFGKTSEHNLALLAHIGELVRTGAQQGNGVLVGTSRKRFLGAFGAPSSAEPRSVEERAESSLATAVWAMAQGAGMVRVHDVRATVQAATLVGRPGEDEGDVETSGERPGGILHSGLPAR